MKINKIIRIHSGVVPIPEVGTRDSPKVIEFGTESSLVSLAFFSLSVRSSINRQNIDIGIRLIKILRQNRKRTGYTGRKSEREKLILYHVERFTFQIMFRIRKYLSLPDSVMRAHSRFLPCSTRASSHFFVSLPGQRSATSNRSFELQGKRRAFSLFRWSFLRRWNFLSSHNCIYEILFQEHFWSEFSMM